MVAPAEPAAASKEPAKAPEEKADPTQKKKLPSNVLAFAHRNGVTATGHRELFLLDHEPILPVYKIRTGKTAHSQMCKVMMVLLENGL